MARKTILPSLSAACMLLLLLTSCNDRVVFEQYVPIPGHGWSKDVPVRFTVNITDTTGTYGVFVHVRNNDAYPYSNLYLFRSISSSYGLEQQDTVQYTLADTYGKWTGSGSGSIRHNKFPYRLEALRFYRPGEYTFTLVQAMRSDTLRGIEDLGLSVEKTEP